MGATVQRHDARIVHHLVEDDDVVRRLEDLNVLVIAGRHDRRTGVEPQETPFGQPAVLRPVRPDAADAEPHRTLRLAVLGCLTRHPRARARDPAVRWVDDERRPPVVDDAGAAVEPEVVVAAHISAHRQRFGADLAGPVGVDGGLDGLRLDLRRFLCRQQRLAILRPLQRRQRPEVPDPLQVRFPVRQTRRPALGAGRGRQSDHDRERRQRGKS